ncbi:hypothetical protein M406DRAFT_71444 [Cryphonectria parasitica EP155]|uniref:DUF7607 domain-containing protein n=1 Tax=Cryphonectria parasitica (strain ATCC 38755 / EP155) TaxID=660469 RepID=A0A9P4Y8M3_CRYP1|nr:uncharacterized protein M406DRAFT_71444 [Cryphonectria parasitica EP155]KAF3768434.1 hypothetical protein M406DRAFT_71444 [Cryphonectria parasitica EP155]
MLFGRARKRYVNGLISDTLVTPTASSGGNDNKSALPVFGESDNDDNPEWEDIDHEIEEEEEEVRREQERGLAKKSQLQPSQVDTFIEQIVQEYISRWEENKLPARQRQAFFLCDKARRNGARNSQVVRLTDLVKP